MKKAKRASHQEKVAQRAEAMGTTPVPPRTYTDALPKTPPNRKTKSLGVYVSAAAFRKAEADWQTKGHKNRSRYIEWLIGQGAPATKNGYARQVLEPSPVPEMGRMVSKLGAAAQLAMLAIRNRVEAGEDPSLLLDAVQDLSNKIDDLHLHTDSDYFETIAERTEGVWGANHDAGVSEDGETYDSLLSGADIDES